MKKFYVRASAGVYLDAHTVNLLVSAYERSDLEFLEIVSELIEIAKRTDSPQVFEGGGLLDMWVHPNGVLEITSNVMCLDLMDVEESWQPTEEISKERIREEERIKRILRESRPM